MTRREWLLGWAGFALAPRLGAKSGSLRIYLARHGESEANAAHTIAGWTDAPLTAKGREQAHALAEALKGIRLDAVYSSTLSRSRETAQIAAPGMRAEALPALRERNFGQFEKGSDTAPEFIRRRFLDDDNLGGAETGAQFLERVRAAVTGIVRQHPTGAILIAAHRFTNQKILQSLMSYTPAEANAIVQDNDEVYSMDIVPGRPPLLWKLIREKNLGDL